ncbi:hypothetical protein, partial [Cupriavidus sp. M-11]|uniref:hypothetical protein n=1 Tax=Cupriavidus sp. M-11 TaxID=3233038 RepID=UPI003F90FC9E
VTFLFSKRKVTKRKRFLQKAGRSDFSSEAGFVVGALALIGLLTLPALAAMASRRWPFHVTAP